MSIIVNDLRILNQWVRIYIKVELGVCCVLLYANAFCESRYVSLEIIFILLNYFAFTKKRNHVTFRATKLVDFWNQNGYITIFPVAQLFSWNKCYISLFGTLNTSLCNTACSGSLWPNPTEINALNLKASRNNTAFGHILHLHLHLVSGYSSYKGRIGWISKNWVIIPWLKRQFQIACVNRYKKSRIINKIKGLWIWI